MDTESDLGRWSWLPEAQVCLPIHQQNAINRQKFFDEAAKLDNHLSQLVQQIKLSAGTTSENRRDVRQLTASIQVVIGELRSCQSQLDSLANMSAEITPPHAPKSSVTSPSVVVALTNYTHKEDEIVKNMFYLLVDMSDPVWWKIETVKGKELSVPSVILTIPPPDKEATDTIDRLTNWSLTTWEMANELYKATVRDILFLNLFSSEAKPLDAAERWELRRILGDKAVDLLTPGGECKFRQCISNWLQQTDQLPRPTVPASEGAPDMTWAQAISQLIAKIEELDALTRANKDARLSRLVTKHLAQSNIGSFTGTESASSIVAELNSHSFPHSSQAEPPIPRPGAPLFGSRPSQAPNPQQMMTAGSFQVPEKIPNAPRNLADVLPDVPSHACQLPNPSTSSTPNSPSAFTAVPQNTSQYTKFHPQRPLDDCRQFLLPEREKSESEVSKVSRNLSATLAPPTSDSSMPESDGENRANWRGAVNADGRGTNPYCGKPVGNAQSLTQRLASCGFSFSSLPTEKRSSQMMCGSSLGTSQSPYLMTTGSSCAASSAFSSCDTLSKQNSVQTMVDQSAELARHQQEIENCHAADLHAKLKKLKDFEELRGQLINALETVERQLSIFNANDESAVSRIALSDLETFDDITAEFRSKERLLGRFSELSAVLVEYVDSVQKATELQNIVTEVTRRFETNNRALTDKRFWLVDVLERKGEKRRAREGLRAWIADARRRLEENSDLTQLDDVGSEQQFSALVNLVQDYNMHRAQIRELAKDDPEPAAAADLQREFDQLGIACRARLEKRRAQLDVLAEIRNMSQELSTWIATTSCPYVTTGSTVSSLEVVERTHQESKEKMRDLEALKSRALDFVAQVDADSIKMGHGMSEKWEFDVLLDPIFDLQLQLHRLPEIIAKRAASIAALQIISMKAYLDKVSGELENADSISVDPNALTQQLAEYKSCHDDVVRRCDNFDETLTKCLVIMHGVLVKDVQNTRLQAEAVRDRAMVIKQLSAKRVFLLDDVLPVAASFRSMHRELQSSFAAIRAQIDSVEIPNQGNTDTVRNEIRDAQVIYQKVLNQKPVIDDLMEKGQYLMGIVTHDDMMSVIDDMKEISTTYEQMRASIHGKLGDLKQAFQTQALELEVLASGCFEFLRVLGVQAANSSPIACSSEALAEQVTDNQTLVMDLHRCLLLIGQIRQQSLSVTEHGDASDSCDDCPSDVQARLDEFEAMHRSMTAQLRCRANQLTEAQRAVAKYEHMATLTRDTLNSIEDQLTKTTINELEMSEVGQHRRLLQTLKTEIEKCHDQLSDTNNAAGCLRDICGAAPFARLDAQLADLADRVEAAQDQLRKSEAEMEAELTLLQNYSRYYQAACGWLPQFEDKLDQMPDMSTVPHSIKKQIGDFKLLTHQLFAHGADIDCLNFYCETVHKMILSSTVVDGVKEINAKWQRLQSSALARESGFIDALVDMEAMEEAFEQVSGIFERTIGDIPHMESTYGDAEFIEISIRRLLSLQQLVAKREPLIGRLSEAVESQSKCMNVDKLSERLVLLKKLAAHVHHLIRRQHMLLLDRLFTMNDFMCMSETLLHEVLVYDRRLRMRAAPGNVVESIQDEYDAFMEEHGELESLVEKIMTLLENGQQICSQGEVDKLGQMRDRLSALHAQTHTTLTRSQKHCAKLEEHLKNVKAFHETLTEHSRWVAEAETDLKHLGQCSKVLETNAQQIMQHQRFEEDMDAHRGVMDGLERAGFFLRYFGCKREIARINEQLVAAQQDWKRVVIRSEWVGRNLQNGCRDVKKFVTCWSSLCDWLDDKRQRLLTPIVLNAANIDKIADETRRIHVEMATKHTSYYCALQFGRMLKDRCPVGDPERIVLGEMLEQVKTRWRDVWPAISHREGEVQRALASLQRIVDASESVYESLLRFQETLDDDQPVCGDLQTVQALNAQHRAIKMQLDEKQSLLSLLRSTPEMDQRVLKRLENTMTSVLGLSVIREQRLQEANKLAEEYRSISSSLMEWLTAGDQELEILSNTPQTEEQLGAMMQSLNLYCSQVVEKNDQLQRLITIMEDILKSCNANAIQSIRHSYSVLEASWLRMQKKLKQCEQHLKLIVDTAYGTSKVVEDLLTWTTDAMASLNQKINSGGLSDDPQIIEGQLNNHLEFHKELIEKRKEIEKLVKEQANAVALNCMNSGKDVANDDDDSRRSSAAADLEQRVLMLQQKWNLVWKMSVDFKKKLQESLAELQRAQSLEKFSFNDWKQRYSSFMRCHLLRVTDFFRTQSQDCTGTLTRREFVEGIMASKFPSSRTELNHVFDIIDNARTGKITYQQIKDVLLHDRQVNRPKTVLTTEQQIQEAIQQQLAVCQCSKWFPVQRVDDGVYRFGDKRQRKEPYFVRVVNGVVMVRIGANWEPIGDFFERVDPCRCKLPRSFVAYNDRNCTPIMMNPSLFLPKKRATMINLTEGMQSPTSILARSYSVLSPRSTANSGATCPGAGCLSSPRAPRPASRNSPRATSPGGRPVLDSKRLSFDPMQKQLGWPPVTPLTSAQ